VKGYWEKKRRGGRKGKERGKMTHGAEEGERKRKEENWASFEATIRIRIEAIACVGRKRGEKVVKKGEERGGSFKRGEGAIKSICVQMEGGKEKKKGGGTFLSEGRRKRWPFKKANVLLGGGGEKVRIFTEGERRKCEREEGKKKEGLV